MDGWEQVRAWRKGERARLIGERMLLRGKRRVPLDAAITATLVTLVPRRGSIGFYWPIRGEYDARKFVTSLLDDGARLALPVVVEKAAPVVFREWRPGAPMTSGFWDIPIPADGESLLPDTLLVPLVGFDERGYRLGYGGGYYDRTLAAAVPKPQAIGVGYEFSRLETIYPQAHDIPMSLIVTEARTFSGTPIQSAQSIQGKP
jgi:5-formyltetrahydrofolate cyclo-ligase